MKVLVTGGTGFIGRYLCERLAAQGHQVSCLDRVPPDAGMVGQRFIRGDVRRLDVVRAAMDGIDAVFHLAAAHHDHGIADRTYFDVNEAGTRVVCSAMEEYEVDRLCFVSSVAVYGVGSRGSERESPAPGSAYGESKLAAEEVCRSWQARKSPRTLLLLRPTATFGPRNYANMYSLIRQIHRRRFVQVGSGRNAKSLAYVDNLVDAVLALWAESCQGVDVFNIVDKPDLQSREIAGAVYRSLGRVPPRIVVPVGLAVGLATPVHVIQRFVGGSSSISPERIRKFAAAETTFDAEKLASTGYTARVDLQEGIRRMVQWFVTEGVHAAPADRIPPPDPGRW